MLQQEKIILVKGMKTRALDVKKRKQKNGVRATILWDAVLNPLKKVECVHSFKKALIDFLDFYAAS